MTKEELKARLQGERYRKPSFWDKHFPKAFLYLGIALFIGGIAVGISNYVFMENSEKTVGIVIRLDGGAYRQGYAPVIEYYDNQNKAHLFYSNEFARPPRFKVGEKLPMYYKLNNPENASMGISWLAVGVLCGLGTVFTFFGVIFQKFFNS
ncbi:MAG: DUF3592 domain-containing protein [Bacteroidetes bacterium]|nr:DUF3592 domain-containing protein [Bacteroidota bacterium]